MSMSPRNERPLPSRNRSVCSSGRRPDGHLERGGGPVAESGDDEQPAEHRPFLSQDVERRELDRLELEVGRAVPTLAGQEVG